MNNNTEHLDKEERQEKMKPRNITVQDSLWEAAKQKAKIAKMSALVRRLLELYVSGKLDEYF